MEKQICITEARDKLKQLLDEVQHQGHAYVINRHGRAAVAVVPLAVYENWKQSRHRLIDLIHEVQDANAAVDPNAVMQDVLHAQRAIRS